MVVFTLPSTVQKWKANCTGHCQQLCMKLKLSDVFIWAGNCRWKQKKKDSNRNAAVQLQCPTATQDLPNGRRWIERQSVQTIQRHYLRFAFSLQSLNWLAFPVHVFGILELLCVHVRRTVRGHQGRECVVVAYWMTLWFFLLSHKEGHLSLICTTVPCMCLQWFELLSISIAPTLSMFRCFGVGGGRNFVK